MIYIPEKDSEGGESSTEEGSEDQDEISKK